MAKQKASTGTTRDALIEAAMSLFLKKGYSTTVDEICAEAAVSKGSFYHFFGTKEDLGLATLDAFYQAGAERFARGGFARLEGPGDQPGAFLEFVESRAEEFWRDGCLYGSFATELAETHPKIRRKVSRMLNEIAERWSPFFLPAVRQGGPDAKSMARQLLVVIEGAIILARAEGDAARIREAVSYFRQSLIPGKKPAGKAAR